MKKLLTLMLTLLLCISLLEPCIIYGATTKLNMSKLTLNVGEAYTLRLTGASGTVKWSSSNKNIATVSSKGKVVAKAEGKTTITATNKSKKYKCTITIKDPIVEIILGAFIFDDTSIDDYIKEYENEYLNYIAIKPYSDTHILLSTKDSERRKALDKVYKEIDNITKEMLSSEDFGDVFTKIETDKLYKEVTIYANKEIYENAFAGFSVMLTLGLISDIVQGLNLIDVEDRECNITIIDSTTGDILYPKE